MVELNNLTIKELEKHINDAQNILAKKKTEQVEENRKKIEDYAKSLGLSIDELFGKKTSKQKSPSKKRDVLYIDDTGKEFYRALKEWTPEQREQFKKNVKSGDK